VSEPERPAAKEKTYEDWLARGYVAAPDVSFVIQSHNASEEVLPIVERLREHPNAELIVLDDGSGPEHTARFAAELTRGNEFLLRSNDLYEVITYDRAIGMARGRIVALLQDDDDFPSLDWVDEALRLFERFPQLAILGGRDAFDFEAARTTEDGEPLDYAVDGEHGESVNLFRFHIVSAAAKRLGSPFWFVQTVNRAPMLVRRDHFVERLRHIDQAYAPFHWDDAELCLRAWSNGLQVGWYDAGFAIGAQHEGGMRTWNRSLHRRQNEVNIRRLYERYADGFPALQKRVDEANSVLPKPPWSRSVLRPALARLGPAVRSIGRR
jgi:GT2 family glycosyltransferase